VKSNQLKGHTLLYGGVYLSGQGIAICSCNACSAVSYNTTVARRAWHRQHTEEVRRIQSEQQALEAKK
jgi:hypothetical protein